jgi:hypothetical protein
MRIYQRNCRGFIARWFANRGWAAVTLPLPFVTVILYWDWPGEVPDWIRRHERAHASQAQRLTWIGFYWCYLIGLLHQGYRDHWMEVEARAAEETKS